MLYSELRSKDWIVPKKVGFVGVRALNIPSIEQECHFYAPVLDDDGERSGIVYVDCTNQTYLTQLSQSQFFTVSECTVSQMTENCEKDGFLLGVKGFFAEKGLSIRKKVRVFSDQEILDRAERMRKMHEMRKKQ